MLCINIYIYINKYIYIYIYIYIQYIYICYEPNEGVRCSDVCGMSSKSIKQNYWLFIPRWMKEMITVSTE